jgi:hypothetical protein
LELWEDRVIGQQFGGPEFLIRLPFWGIECNSSTVFDGGFRIYDVKKLL